MSIGIFTLFLAGIMLFGSIITEQIAISLLNKNQAPSLEYLFGTDWVGEKYVI